MNKYRFNYKTLFLDAPYALTFDDVLIVPKYSELLSRFDPSLSVDLGKGIKLKTPLVSANMDTVTESKMCIAMAKHGGFGILHRFMSIEEQIKQVKEILNSGVDVTQFSVALGTKTQYEKDRAVALVEECGVFSVTVDIAHGHSIMMKDMLTFLREKFKDNLHIIAGNVATHEGVNDLVNWGADVVKVGIAGGRACATKFITGVGFPQLTAVAEGAYAKLHNSRYFKIISDGGIKMPGDIVKALAAGADCVMIGSLFAGTDEAPGRDLGEYKLYRGMASRDVQEEKKGGLRKGLAAEGITMKIKKRGPVKNIIDYLCGGIRSGMCYLNASKIDQIKENAEFVLVNTATSLDLFNKPNESFFLSYNNERKD